MERQERLVRITDLALGNIKSLVGEAEAKASAIPQNTTQTEYDGFCKRLNDNFKTIQRYAQKHGLANSDVYIDYCLASTEAMDNIWGIIFQPTRKPESPTHVACSWDRRSQ